MSWDSDLDESGYDVHVLVCDYCATSQPASFAGYTTVEDWIADGWDIDPRPGRDRCPDCVAHLDQAPTNANDSGTVVAVGVP